MEKNIYIFYISWLPFALLCLPAVQITCRMKQAQNEVESKHISNRKMAFPTSPLALHVTISQHFMSCPHFRVAVFLSTINFLFSNLIHLPTHLCYLVVVVIHLIILGLNLIKSGSYEQFPVSKLFEGGLYRLLCISK